MVNEKIPDIQSIRQNFIGWEHDQKNLDNVAQTVTKVMKNQENYYAIKLNSLDNRTIKQGYIIANGIKTNLDNDSQTILQWIADKL